MKERPYQVIINTNGNIIKQRVNYWKECEKLIIANQDSTTEILIIDNNGKYQYAYSQKTPRELIEKYKRGGII